MKKEEYEEILLKQNLAKNISSAINWSIATIVVFIIGTFLLSIIGWALGLICLFVAGSKWGNVFVLYLSLKGKKKRKKKK